MKMMLLLVALFLGSCTTVSMTIPTKPNISMKYTYPIFSDKKIQVHFSDTVTSSGKSLVVNLDVNSVGNVDVQKLSEGISAGILSAMKP